MMVLRSLLVLLLLLPAACAPVVDQKMNAEVHETLGNSYLQEGNATKALAEFMQAAEADPKSASIQSGLAQAYQRKKAFSQAEDHYLRALTFSDQDPLIRNNLAALYLNMQRWEDALAQFRLAADNLLFQTPEVAQTGMAVAQYKLGRYLDAVESCHRALQTDPQYPVAHLYLGRAYDALEKPELAVGAYKKALVFYPDYLEARYRLGLAYMRQKKTSLARTEFEKVISAAPESTQGQLAQEYLALLN